MTFEEFTELTSLTRSGDNEAFYRKIVEPVYMQMNIGKRAFCIVFSSALNDREDKDSVFLMMKTFIAMLHSGTDQFFDMRSGRAIISALFS